MSKNEDLEHYENKPIKVLGLEWVVTLPIVVLGISPSTTIFYFFIGWIVLFIILAIKKISFVSTLKILFSLLKGKVCHARKINNRK